MMLQVGALLRSQHGLSFERGMLRFVSENLAGCHQSELCSLQVIT